MARSSRQSALRYPLTIVLGAEANVRLLRELARHGGELAAASLVMRTGLAQSSVREALIVLEELGIVEAIGSGRTRLFRMERKHPLASMIDRLFRIEEERFDAILAGIRAAAERCGEGIVAVWIYGSVARGQDGPASDVDIAVVAEPEALPQADEAMREGLASAEESLAFAASVVAVSTHDMLRLRDENDPWWTDAVQGTIPIVGMRPDELVSRLRHPLERRRKAS